MSDPHVDIDLVTAFENSLDPRFPERGPVQARVLGYGEISTVLELGTGEQRRLAYKRLSMFENENEAIRYEALYHEYVRTLNDRVGLRVVPSEIVSFRNTKGRTVSYIVQERYPGEAFAHKAIHGLSPLEVTQLVRAVLEHTGKVFAFNEQNRAELEIGFDGQMSNWALAPDSPRPGQGRTEDIALVYFDTSTPLMRRQGQEQLDPELFLRNAPAPLAWVIRRLFLQDVMTRYYDSRKVAVDLVANFLKEQRSDLVPVVVETVNEHFSAAKSGSDLRQLTVKEIKAYYREDAWIWRTYLGARRIDRAFHRIAGKEYPYILPGRIRR